MNPATALTLAVILALGVVDGWLYWLYGDSATISRGLLDLSYQYPVIPLMFGVLAGHLFWPQSR